MSINTLLENPASQSKPWCNLYVDTLTAYKGAKINGDLEVNGIKFSENGELLTYKSQSFAYNQSYNSSNISTKNILFVKVGRQVTLWIDQTTYPSITLGNSYFTLTPSESLPIEFAPSQDFEKPIFVNHNNTKVVGNLTMSTTGEILIFASANGGNFTGGQSGGYYDVFLTYLTSN